jgi:invasion protein IalB
MTQTSGCKSVDDSASAVQNFYRSKPENPMMLITTATARSMWPLCILFFVLLIQPAAALEEGKRFQDWTIGCEKLTDQANAQERCFIYQTVVNNETDQPVLQIAIGYLPGDEKPAAILTVPLGVALPPGMGVSVDDGDVIRIPYERCVPKGCIAGIPLNDEVIGRFKRGLKAKVLLHDGTRQVALPVSLKGFTKGFDSLR